MSNRQLDALQGSHHHEHPSVGRPGRIWAADVVTVNPDGTVDVQPVSSRATKVAVPVPSWYTPTIGDRVFVCDLNGDPRVPVVLAPLKATAGTTSGVTSFDGRTGAVTLTKADVTGTGLAAADVGALPASTTLVNTFQGRSGAVTLTKADVTGTGLAASDVGALPVGTTLVSTFNGRSGAVTLSKADVTGTGVAAVDVGALPTKRYLVVETYGAKVDGQVREDGAMTSGSATLTCATTTPFTSADVGKSITVAGAGAAGATLVTTISGFTDSGHVTLAAAASTTVSAKQVIWGTDDTAAWNNAFQAIAAAASATSPQPGGIVYCSKTGISLVNGALDATHKGVLVLPIIPYNQTLADAGNQFWGAVVGIEGPAPPPFAFAEGSAGMDNRSSLVILANGAGAQASTGGAATGAVITAGLASALNTGTDMATWNAIVFYGRNFTVRTPESSAYNGLDLSNAEQMDVDAVCADVQAHPVNLIQPQGGNAGIITPKSLNGALVTGGRISAIGYTTGCDFCEHANFREVAVGYCTNGARFAAGAHLAAIGRLVTSWCTNHIVAKGDGTIKVKIGWSIEADGVSPPPPSWTNVVHHINDASNFLQGKIDYIYTGNPRTPLVGVSGGTNLRLDEVDTPYRRDVDQGVAQSANFTAIPGQMNYCTGAITGTLPAAPPPDCECGFVALTGTVTISRGGTDTIDQYTLTGLTSIKVPAGSAVVLKYLSGIWYLVRDERPPAALTVASARCSTAQSMTANTNVKILLNTAIDDPFSNFDLATNHRYNITIPGRYWVSAEVSAGTGALYAMVFKTGVEQLEGPGAGGDGTVSGYINCAAGDYLELWGNIVAGGTLTTGVPYNRLDVQRVA